MQRPHRTTRGFTLLEMLLSLSLMAVIMVAAAIALHAAQKSHAYNNDKTDLVARTRGVLDRLGKDVRTALSVEVLDARTIVVTQPNGVIQTYQWDGATGGNLNYIYQEGLYPNEPVALTGNVESFSVEDGTPTYTLRIALKGTLARSDAAITATPRKSLY